MEKLAEYLYILLFILLYIFGCKNISPIQILNTKDLLKVWNTKTKMFLDKTCDRYATDILNPVLLNENKTSYRKMVLLLLQEKTKTSSINDIMIHEVWNKRGYTFSLLTDTHFESYESKMCTGEFLEIKSRYSSEFDSIKDYFYEKDYSSCTNLEDSISSSGFIILSKIVTKKEKLTIEVIRMSLF